MATPRATVVHLAVGGRQRTYVLQAPHRPVRLLVVALHDFAHGPDQARGWRLDAELPAGTAFVYPAAISGAWSAGACCGLPARQHVDDVAFLHAALRDARTRLAAPTAPAVLVGHSTGAMLALDAACRDGATWRRVVAVAGPLVAPCRPAKRLPATTLVGASRDATTPVDRSAWIAFLGFRVPSLRASAAALASAAGCAAVAHADHGSTTWSRCRRGGPVRLVVVPGGGHGWSAVGGSAAVARLLLAA